jgi:hypothetical protein
MEICPSTIPLASAIIPPESPTGARQNSSFVLAGGRAAPSGRRGATLLPLKNRFRNLPKQATSVLRSRSKQFVVFDGPCINESEYVKSKTIKKS